MGSPPREEHDPRPRGAGHAPELSLDDLATLALFARVVEDGSLSAAARAFGVTKSAVSRRIDKLEARLGVKLLLRTPRKIAATSEGQRVYAHGARVLAESRAALETAHGAGQELRGRVSVNAPRALCERHLVPLLAGFLAEHPDVHVDLTAEDRFVDVVEGGFDLVIRMGRLASSSLVVRRLGRDRIVMCASPAYLARVGIPRSAADLGSHQLLHYSLVPAEREWRFEGEDGPVTVPARGALSANDGGVLQRAAIAGLGLALVPYYMVADDVAAGHLALVPLRLHQDEVGVYAVLPQGHQVPRRVAALVELFASSLALPVAP